MFTNINSIVEICKEREREYLSSNKENHESFDDAYVLPIFGDELSYLRWAVEMILEKPTTGAEHLHELRAQVLRTYEWEYAESFDIERKTTPTLVPYSHLQLNCQQKLLRIAGYIKTAILRPSLDLTPELQQEYLSVDNKTVISEDLNVYRIGDSVYLQNESPSLMYNITHFEVLSDEDGLYIAAYITPHTLYNLTPRCKMDNVPLGILSHTIIKT